MTYLNPTGGYINPSFTPSDHNTDNAGPFHSTDLHHDISLPKVRYSLEANESIGQNTTELNNTDKKERILVDGEIQDVKLSPSERSYSDLNTTGKTWTDNRSWTTPVDTPIDGGWGWFIVLSSMVIHLIVGGVDRSGGVLYLKFEEKFQAPAAVTAWVPSIANGLRLSLGPIVSVLCNRFSHRTVVIWSGVILAVASVASGFATNLYFLFISYSIVGGVGFAMAYSPSVVVLSLYFRQKLGTALGLGTSGVGLGAFAIPLLLESCFVYYGYLGCFIILSGLCLELIVCGCLMRPLSIHRKINAITKRKLSKRQTTVTNSAPTTEKKLQVKMLKEVDIVVKVPRKIQRGSVVSFMRRMSSAAMFWKANDTDKSKVKLKVKHKTFDFSLLKDMRYCAFCVAILFFTLAFQSGFIFLPAFAKQIGTNDFEAAYTVMISGLSDGVGRLFAGFLFDRTYIKPIRVYLYNIAMLLMGMTSFCIPSAVNFFQLAVISAIYGCLVGMYVSQKSVIIVDLLGEENLSNSFGMLLLFQGIGTFIGPPLSGLLKDINGMYDYAFYFGGCGVLLGSLILLITNIIHYVNSRQSYQTN